MRHSLAFVIAAAIAMLPGTTVVDAQTRGASIPQVIPDMSGLWLVQDPGSGNWSAWFNNVPKPAVRPEIIKDNAEIEAREAAGNVVNTMPRRADCPVGNLPMMMASSPPLNIVAAQGEVLIAAEAGRGRFIYTDGRAHPDTKAPFYVPSGFGHSIGRWEGDAFVVESKGFNDQTWLDDGGHPHSDAYHSIERFHRRDFGHMDMEITIDDPKSYTKPWKATIRFEFFPDMELMESVCENELDTPHMIGK